MLKEAINTGYYVDFHDQQNQTQLTVLTDPINEAIYGSDEFRMYAYKIKRCPRTRSHDWTECPYAHRGEKAQRRDPRKYSYAAITCPAFRNGKCQKGDFCEFAHGVFEYWLHPERYRTRACNAGKYCQRKVCFFAHTPEQLRSETKYKCQYAYRARMGELTNGRDFVGNVLDELEGDGLERTASLPVPTMVEKKEVPLMEDGGFSEFFKSLMGLKIRDKDIEVAERNAGILEVSDSDLPHVGWISELVK